MVDEGRDIALSETVAFVEQMPPTEAADYLLHLDDRLVESMCRPDTAPEERLAQGLAYWLLKDALTRRVLGDGTFDPTP